MQEQKKYVGVHLSIELVERVQFMARQRSIRERRRVTVCEVIRHALYDACNAAQGVEPVRTEQDKQAN